MAKVRRSVSCLLHVAPISTGSSAALRDVRQHADPHLTAILVANKVDLCESDAGGESRSRHRREVTTEEGERFAQEEGLLFIEASAKSGHNVEAVGVHASLRPVDDRSRRSQAFDEAARDILRKIQSGVFNDSKVCTGLVLAWTVEHYMLT